MTVHSIDSVCSHDDLSKEVGGSQRLATLLPDEYDGSSAIFRQLAYEDVLASLRRRTTPILETDLADVTQLRQAVAYGAAARLYRSAMTTRDDVWTELEKRYQRMFESETLGLTPSLSGGLRGSAFTIDVERG